MLIRTSRAIALAPALILSGCAHYYLPATQLDTPESIGAGLGRIEILGIQTGTDLLTPPQTQPTDPETGVTPDPTLQRASPSYAFGASMAATSKLDLGVRFAPYAPLMARAKYQFYGEPESSAAAGNFSVSISGSGGLLLASQQGSSVTFYTGNAALIGGYRFAQRHLASLAPFFSLAGLSGTGASDGNGTRFGASLGYQYDVEAMILRAELTWASGSISQATGSASAGGIFPGAMLGFKL